jgi:hypothetical protein
MDPTGEQGQNEEEESEEDRDRAVPFFPPFPEGAPPAEPQGPARPGPTIPKAPAGGPTIPNAPPGGPTIPKSPPDGGGPTIPRAPNGGPSIPKAPRGGPTIPKAPLDEPPLGGAPPLPAEGGFPPPPPGALGSNGGTPGPGGDRPRVRIPRAVLIVAATVVVVTTAATVVLASRHHPALSLPTVTILSGPCEASASPCTTDSTTATFRFGAPGASAFALAADQPLGPVDVVRTAAVSGFQCRLDGGTFARCSSPKTFTRLAVGGHRFSVRAVGKSGTTGDATTFGWTVGQPGPLPELRINDQTVPEGDHGKTSARITVTLSPASQTTVTVDYATFGGTATAGKDFTVDSGTLTFHSGETTKTIVVSVIGDTQPEPDEHFSIKLSNPANVTVATAIATVTILDDDRKGHPALRVNDQSVPEGNSATTRAHVTVTLTPPSPATVTVRWATVSGTATAGKDFTSDSGTLTFHRGQASKTITVSVIGDTQPESDEDFSIKLSHPSGAEIATGSATATVTILDDDIPALSITGTSVKEGNGGTAQAQLKVTLSPASPDTVTVQWNTVAGSATAGKDFVSNSGLLTFLKGQTTQTITVSVIGDTAPESDEHFSVQLLSPTKAQVTRGSATVTIQDDDATSLRIENQSVTEGDAGTRTALVKVTLSPASPDTVTVHWATEGGSATAGKDFRSGFGTLTFPRGQTTQNITVTVIGDTQVENDENLFVTLSNPVNARVAAGRATVTIHDNDVPSITIVDTSVPEGDSGTKPATVTVSLSSPSPRSVTVHYSLAGVTATAGKDFQAASGSVTFPSGKTTETITAQVIGDTEVENDETFAVNLSNASNAKIADGSATVTIQDDDIPSITISDTSVPEGDSGTKPATVTVSLSSPSPKSVSVHLATADGTATAGKDYQSVSETVIFSSQQSSKTVTLTVIGDTVVEDDETFMVNLSSPVSARIADGTATVTILNDDIPTFTITGTSVPEGNSGTSPATVQVTLSPASPKTVTVDYATKDGTATAGSDYVAKSGTLTFTSGHTSATITISVIGDTTQESDETFSVNLSNATNGAKIGTGSATVTIKNDDFPIPRPPAAVGHWPIDAGPPGWLQGRIDARLYGLAP